MGKDPPGRRGPRIDGVLGPSGLVGLPAIKTLSDEYRDTREPEDSDRVPPPVPPSLMRRLIDRLTELSKGRSSGGAD